MLKDTDEICTKVMQSDLIMNEDFIKYSYSLVSNPIGYQL